MSLRGPCQVIENLWRNRPGPSMLLAMSDASESAHETQTGQPPEEQTGRPPEEQPARRFGWSDMFVHPDDDPREVGEDLPGERATLVRHLRDQRLTLELKWVAP